MKKDFNKQSYGRFQQIAWKDFVTFLAIASSITMIIPWALYGLFSLTASGEQGWGLLALIPALTLLWLAGYIFAAIDIAAAIFYLIRKKAPPLGVAVGVAVVALAIIYAVGMAYYFNWLH